MRFIECYVENFGKLSDFRYRFDRGLNVIHADNGYGKTTLTAFIKCMLYGMEDTKKQDLAENDRKHYMPWQGGVCGGRLDLEHEGRRYRIERYFAPKAAEDSFALYDLDSGRLSQDYTPSLGEEMLGIDRDGFERTLFLSERRLSGKNDNKSISAKLSDLVGCDGDIGGVDAAMKRLEEKRKYYKKTGGRGLIDELAAKISVCAAEEATLERAREESKWLEVTLAEEKQKLAAIDEKKRALEAERDAMRTNRSRLALSEQYNAMLAGLNRDRARLEELRAAFGGVLPSPEEIDNAVYKLREAESIDHKLKMSGEDPEFTALALRFEGKTDLPEMERTAALADEIPSERERLLTMPKGSTERSRHFSKRIPERHELISAKKKLGGGALAPITLTLALAAAAALWLLINPYFAIIPAALWLIITVIGSSAAAKRRSRVEDMLSELSDEPTPRKRRALRRYIDLLLSELDTEAARAEEDGKAERAREEIMRGIAEREAAISALLARLGVQTDDPLSEIRRQRADYLRYYGASIGAEASRNERQSALARMQGLRREAEEFLSRFTGLGDSPFEKLKEMLREYNYLISSTAERARECAQLKEKYGIDEVPSFDPERLSAVEKELRECEGLLETRRRECSAIEIRLAGDAEKYERIHELKSRAAALEEQKAEAEDALDTVQRTKAALQAAMENMTSRYLGKTREGFERYRRMIEGESRRDFLLDTSFALSVGDVGGTHPEEAYSRGTRDVYALATRLALSDALYEGDLPPIILDDPFTALDDRGLAEALRLIEKTAKARQVIYLTCHRSRKPE